MESTRIVRAFLFYGVLPNEQPAHTPRGPMALFITLCYIYNNRHCVMCLGLQCCHRVIMSIWHQPRTSIYTLAIMACVIFITISYNDNNDNNVDLHC